jgi:hypothetical protein
MFRVDGPNLFLDDLTALIAITSYNAKKPALMLGGLILGEDLMNERKEILYTKGTELTHDRMTRIVRRQENNPDFIFNFFISRTDQMITTFKTAIASDFKKLIASKQKVKSLRVLFENISNDAENLVESALQDEGMIFSAMTMKFSTASGKEKIPSLLYFHSINVGLFSLALVRSETLAPIVNFTPIQEKNLLLAAMLHNIGAVTNSEYIFNLQPEYRKDKYLEYTLRGLGDLGRLFLPREISDPIRTFIDFLEGRHDCVGRSDPTSMAANVLAVADSFCTRVFGIFDDRVPIKDVVDKLNVAGFERQMHNDVVKALTLGLDLRDIFDFYEAIENLMNSCPIEEKGAHPYPMTGMRSPSVFVCRSSHATCEHYEASIKAVSLVKEHGGLSAGRYCRCMLTTPKLLEFYDDHYDDIKGKENGSDKPAKPAKK